MSCPQCVELDTATIVGHAYAKAQAHRLAHHYADEVSADLVGGEYISHYTIVYIARYEELYSGFRNTHLRQFVDSLYDKYKNCPDVCEHHVSYN